MRRGVLIYSGLMVALVGLALYVLGRDVEVTASEREVGTASSLPEIGDLSSPRLSEEEGRLGEAGEPRTIRSDRFEPDPEARLGSGEFLVRVQDAATGAAVAGIELRLIDSPQWAAYANPLLSSAHGFLGIMDRLIEDCVSSTRTDAEGEATMERSGLGGFVVARKGPFLGMAAEPPEGSDTIVVSVEATPSVPIQTVGIDGTPEPGVPVEVVLVQTTSHKQSTRPTREMRAGFKLWAGSTRGPRALIDAPHRVGVISMRTLLAAVPGGRDRSIDLGVRLGIPAAELPIVLLEEGRDPSAPIQLAVPDTGSVAVGVSGGSGGRLSLRLGVDTGRPRRSWAMRPGVRELHLEGHRVIIDKVGLGLALRLEVEDLSGEMAIESRTFPGPRARGETVEVGVTLQDRRPAVKGRVVDARGAPLANRKLVMQLRSLINTVVNTTVTSLQTDGDGRFRLVLRRGDEESVLREVRSAGGHADGMIRVRSRGGGLLEGRVSLGEGQIDGIIDLGQIVMMEAPVVVSGRVVDDRERPIPKVSIDAATPGWGGSSPFAPSSRLTDAEGRFSIRSIADSGEVRLSFACAGYHAPAAVADPNQRDHGHDPRVPAARPPTRGLMTVPIGTHDVTLVLRRGGGLVGSLRLDPGVALETVQVSLQAEVTRPGSARRVELGPDGSFAVESLAPGAMTLRIRDLMTWSELLKIPDIEILPGEICRDPRLQGIDLRGRIDKDYVTYELRVMDRSGRALEHASVHSQGMIIGAEGKRQFSTDERGRLSLVSVGPKLGVHVTKSEYVDVTTEMQPGENEIRLDRRYTVLLTVSTEQSVSPRKVQLQASLFDGAGDRCRSRRGSDSERCWRRRFDCPGPGTYSLDVGLRWRKPESETPRRGRPQSWGTRGVIRSREITIPAGQYLTEIAIPMPPEALAEALRLAGSS
jgi:hypothetical protein